MGFACCRLPSEGGSGGESYQTRDDDGFWRGKRHTRPSCLVGAACDGTRERATSCWAPVDEDGLLRRPEGDADCCWQLGVSSSVGLFCSFGCTFHRAKRT